MQLDGRYLKGDHPLDSHGGVEVHSYKAIVEFVEKNVLAAMATDFGSMMVPGAFGADTLAPFGPGDWIVSDVPATHAWVVRAYVFEASYERI